MIVALYNYWLHSILGIHKALLLMVVFGLVPIRMLARQHYLPHLIEMLKSQLNQQ